jgi:hypothetical protein
MTDSSQGSQYRPALGQDLPDLVAVFQDLFRENVLPQILIRLAVVEPAQFDRLMSIRVLAAAIKEQLMTDQADDNKV